ncbi:MAG: LytTR family transcriptional regulator DNA-binding domain-containing protein [Verrucomicrobiota bacterium]
MDSSSVYDLIDLNAEHADVDAAWIYTVSHALLTLPFEDAIAAFLEFAGHAADADRAWIIGYNREATHFYNTHEWCRPGVPSHVEDLQHTPTGMISWLHEHLVRKQAVMVNAIGRLPRTARALQAEFIRQNNHSVISVPIFHEDRIFAIVGFDATRAPARWGAAVAAALFRCGTLIAAAWTRAETGPAPVMWKPADRHPSLVYLHKGNLLRAVPLDRIIAVRAERDYTRVHLADDVSTMELRPLKAWEALLPRSDFQKIHRGIIANMRRVESLERPAVGNWSLRLHGLPAALPVSKGFRAEVRSRLGF